MLPLLALLLNPAQAASLDNLEVGGLFGTPLATDATAVWWNPASLAAGTGTRISIEGAPTFATVTYNRTDPFFPGEEQYKLAGVVPFAGVATDFGVKNLGIGLALAVPFVRGGTVVDEVPYMDDPSLDGTVPLTDGVGRYHLREGNQTALFIMAGGAYRFFDRVSIGAGLAMVDSTWDARTDSELLSDLHHTIEADFGQDSGYDDSMIEDSRYAATLDFDPLKDITFTFNAGLRVEAVPDKVAFGVTYVHGFRVDHTGDLTLHFGCPPTDDTLGRFGAERFEICNTQINAHGAVGHRFPSRLTLGAQVKPVEALSIEAMGGWVGWSTYTDFEISVTDVGELNEFDTDSATENTPDLVEQERLWKRGNVDSFWFGLDVKGEIGEHVLLGGRVMYDKAATPDGVLGPNNYDANTVMLSALAAVKPVKQLQIGVSYTHHLVATREIATSDFQATLEEDKPLSTERDRTFYPQTSGTYRAQIQRIGLSLKLAFDKKDKGDPFEWRTEEMLQEAPREPADDEPTPIDEVTPDEEAPRDEVTPGEEAPSEEPAPPR